MCTKCIKPQHFSNIRRHSRRTPTPERLRFEHRRRGGSSQRDERNGAAKRRSAEGEQHAKSLPPQSRDKAAKRDGKTEAEVEAERKAKAEKDEADFQVGSFRTWELSSTFNVHT